MRRPILMVLLGLGVLGGYGSAIGQAVHCHRWQEAQHEAMVRAYQAHMQANGNCADPQMRTPPGAPMYWGGPAYHSF